MDKVLIVGIAGGHGSLLTRRLLGSCELIGTDRERWPAKPPDVKFYPSDIRTRGFENILRTERPRTVIHLGLVRHFRGEASERYDINVRGTRRLLDHCRNYGVERILILSTSYVYGALPENPCFMDEDYPLCGSRNYPEIRDLVEVDTLATAFMWKYPDLRTTILRPVPTLGHVVQSSIGSYLRMRRSICMMGFNPMMQFIHEDDLIEAMVLVLESDLRGVFNVSGPGQVPLRVAIRETGGSALPLPEPIARPLIARLFQLGLFPFPPGSIDFIKYPCTIAGDRFVKETGFKPIFGLRELFRSLRVY
ncbi:MAG: NAD-dependent epimerase/dehydratase family protein [Myxococcota bacterium]